jgi:hypothetical protein
MKLRDFIAEKIFNKPVTNNQYPIWIPPAVGFRSSRVSFMAHVTSRTPGTHWLMVIGYFLFGYLMWRARAHFPQE